MENPKKKSGRPTFGEKKCGRAKNKKQGFCTERKRKKGSKLNSQPILVKMAGRKKKKIREKGAKENTRKFGLCPTSPKGKCHGREGIEQNRKVDNQNGESPRRGRGGGHKEKKNNGIGR